MGFESRSSIEVEHKFHKKEAARHLKKANAEFNSAKKRGEGTKIRASHMSNYALHMSAHTYHKGQADMAAKALAGQDTSVMGPRGEHAEGRLPQTNSKTPSA